MLRSKRFWTLDFLKAISILAVILGHIASPFSRFIFAWHMPAFFFASGVLLRAQQEKGEPLAVFSKHDLSRFGGYYLFFGLLGILAESIKVWVLKRPPMDLWQTIVGFVYFMDMSHLNHYGYILWFLPALFWGKIFTRGLICYAKKPAYIFLGAISLFILGWLLPKEFPVGFGIHEGLLAVLWCVLGYLLAKNFDGGKLSSLVGCIAFTAGWIAVGCIPVPYMDLASYAIPFPLSAILYSILVISLWLCLGKYLEKYGTVWGRGIEWLSKYSVYIMGFHVYTNNVAVLFLRHWHYESWWMSFLLSCLLLFPLLWVVVFLQVRVGTMGKGVM